MQTTYMHIHVHLLIWLYTCILIFFFLSDEIKGSNSIQFWSKIKQLKIKGYLSYMNKWINIWMKSGTASSSHSGHLTCITRTSHFSAMLATFMPMWTTKRKKCLIYQMSSGFIPMHSTRFFAISCIGCLLLFF